MNSKELLTTDVITVATTDATDPSTSSMITDLKTLVDGTNYTPIEWIDGGGEPLSAENLDRFEKSFTALIGNSSVTPEAGIIDKITATLEEEIADRVTDIATIHARLSDSEFNVRTAVETESRARIQDVDKLHKRISKFDTDTTPATLRSKEDKLQVIKSITIETIPTNEDDPCVTIETGDIDLKEIDIPTLHTDKIELNTELNGESKSLTQKLSELDSANEVLNDRVDSFALSEVTFNYHDKNVESEDDKKLQVISSIEIDPASEDGTYVKIKKSPIALEEVDIPNVSTNRVYVNTDTEKTLTSKLQDLDDSDKAINARINQFQLDSENYNNTDLDPNYTVYANDHEYAPDTQKLPNDTEGQYLKGTSVISAVYVNPNPDMPDAPYVIVQKELLDLLPVDIPMLPPNWIFGYTDKSDYNNEEHKAYTLDVRLDNIEDRIDSLTTDEIHANDPELNDKKLCEVFDSFKIEDDKVTITKAPIKLSNEDIPKNISSDKIDVSENQTLTEELAKLTQSDIDIKAYIDAQLQEVTKGTLYWKTY